MRPLSIILLHLLPLAVSPLCAQQPAPTYVSLMNSPHDFDLFANSGWDGNWYVGFNSMWIVELVPAGDPASFGRAFIGAKLGRAKTRAIAGKPPWIRAPIHCDIYIGIAPAPAWNSSNNYYLSSCEDAPVEGNSQEALGDTGESRWYWKEIPVSKLAFNEKNYLAVWSTTPEIIDASSGPILAAGKAPGATKAWLNRGIAGAPPLNAEESLETQLNEFAPALAIKLIPKREQEPGRVSVDLVNFKENPEDYVIEIQAQAKNLERVQPEISVDANNWIAFGRPFSNPPFQVKIPKTRIEREISLLVPGNKSKVKQAYLRVTAWNEWEESASTDNFSVTLKN